MGLLAVVTGIAVPQLLAGLDQSRTHAAAQFLASRMALARVQAVARGATVALRFVDDGGEVVFRTYVDGNGNGVDGTAVQPPAKAPVP